MFFKKKKKSQYQPIVENFTITIPIKESSSETEEIIDEETGLPWGWYAHNKQFVDQVESELNALRKKYNEADTILKKCAAIKSYILYVEDGNKHYKELGIYYYNYFKYYVEDSAELKKRIDEYKYIEKNMDRLLQEEKIQKRKIELENKACPTLESDLLHIIKNNPGIFQRDIYKEFDTLLKESISSTLYFLARNNKIIREKSGNSYKLYIRS